MANESTHKKITEISPEVLSKIIWGVFAKFRKRHPAHELNYEHNNVAETNNTILADIFIYIYENYTTQNSHIDETLINNIVEIINKSPHLDTESINSAIGKSAIELAARISNEAVIQIIKRSLASNSLTICKEIDTIIDELKKAEVDSKKICELLKSEKIDVEFDSNFHKELESAIQIIKKQLQARKEYRKGKPVKLVERSGFENFINLERKLIRSFGKTIKTGITSIQLEALCLYGWDATYEQVCKSDNFYKHNGNIRFIPTDLREVFEPSLRKVLNAFNDANKKGGSEKMLKRAGEIFINETERLCADFSNGKILTRSYLKDLMYSMESCDSGFGISIPEFSKYWDINKSTEGKGILEMNKKQSEGFLSDGKKTKNESPWIRIFFVEGQNRLSDAENKMLKTQLEYKVEVLVVFKDAWKHLSKQELKRCDFAVFRIENCPSLMSTQFEKGEAEGIFYTDESMPEQHYNEHLAKILSKENRMHIYEPELENNKVVLGSPLKENHLEGIIGKLEKIYKKSK